MIKFGPSGNSESFYAMGYKHTEQAAKYVKDFGLDCFEYSFGRGVNMSEGKALSIGEAFRAEGIEISVHAPYFINFANPADEAAQKSYGYVLDSAKYLKLSAAAGWCFTLRRRARPRASRRLLLPKSALKCCATISI